MEDVNKGNNIGNYIGKAFGAIAIVMSLYQIFSIIKPIYTPIEHSNLHLAFALVLVFLGSMAKRKSNLMRLFDLLLMLFSLISTAYIQANYVRLTTKVGVLAEYDLLIGLILLVVVFVATIKTFGISLPIITGFLVLYTAYGQYFPGFFNHAGFSWSRVISSMTINFTGIHGSILDISATFLAVFMIFGGLLEASGAGEFFINVALSLAGKVKSGPAQAAVISSCLVGSINGSAVANVATTGVFTIPLMKRCGYKPEMAGAIEAVASTGGMIMPPVMGIGAFVMSGITGIPYTKIALAALIPSLLYYATCAFTVHLHALKNDFKMIDKSELPTLRETFVSGGHFLVPMVTIIYLMIIGMSAMRAGFWGIISLVAVVVIRESIKDYRYLLSGRFFDFMKNGLISGAKGVIMVAPACALMGILSQAMIMSGLAFKIVFFIKTLSGGYAFWALVLTMLITIFFGMGVPTTASYALVAIIGASALIELGFKVLPVHLFIYYYAIMANITPPVASAALVGSQLAKANYMKTGFEAMRIGLPGFILPYLFMYNPELLAQGDILTILTSSVSALIGMFALSAFFEGYIFKRTNLVQRSLLVIASILLIIPGITTDLIGLPILVGVMLWQKSEIKSLLPAQ